MRKRVIIVGANGLDRAPNHRRHRIPPRSIRGSRLSAHTNEKGLRQEAARFPDSALCFSGTLSPMEGIGFVGPNGSRRGGCERPCRHSGERSGWFGWAAPFLAVLSSGKPHMANKESVVMAWPLLDELSKMGGSKTSPIDSEHAALFQLISKIGAEEIDELIITASGGALRDRNLAELVFVKPDEAACHPNWRMGRKITIDSATMANKGLEVIEASRYFGFVPERVRVLVHPQSIVHSLVRTRDGNLYAQLSAPDMRVPIQNALTWPVSMPCPFGRLDLAGKNLEFREPQAERYPLLGLAYRALEAGEGATVAYNAADEVGSLPSKKDASPSLTYRE